VLEVELWYLGRCPVCKGVDKHLRRICARLGVPYIRRYITRYVDPYSELGEFYVVDLEKRTISPEPFKGVDRLMRRLQPTPVVLIKLYRPDGSTMKFVVMGFRLEEQAFRNFELLLQTILRVRR